MNHFATIITQNHFDKALALHASLEAFEDATLHVLVVDASIDTQKMATPNVIIYHQECLMGDMVNQIIITKYRGFENDSQVKLPKDGIINYYDYLRWALKASFVQELSKTHEKVFYCDCDLYFYNDYTFMVEEMNNHNIMISPHWREITPVANTDFRYNYLHGLYNGGFFAVNKADAFLDWWKGMCAIECTAESKNGTYVDQKYLDVVPLYFEGVKILRHKGCNVAGWNINHLKRTAEGEKTKVAGQEIIFIHYSPVTINKIEDGQDYLLRTHLDEYKKKLRTIQVDLARRGLKMCMSDKEIETSLV